VTHPVGKEHEYEPIPGLPERLPEGEHIVWQGRPETKPFARHVMKTRWTLGYFGVLIAWAAIAALHDGRSLGSILFSVAVLGLLGALMLGLCELYAWGVRKTTLYTITNRRIVMRIGVALSLTLNIPFRQIAAVNRVDLDDGTGTLTVQLKDEQRFAWVMLWPHARPWRFAQPEPALRCLADAEAATEALLTTLSNHGAAPAAKRAARADTARPELLVG